MKKLKLLVIILLLFTVFNTFKRPGGALTITQVPIIKLLDNVES